MLPLEVRFGTVEIVDRITHPPERGSGLADNTLIRLRMPEFDDIDRKILQMLMMDARRSYRDIADIVDRSAPTVSNRVDRLHEHGIIQRFTLDIDRSLIADNDASLVFLHTRPHATEEIIDELAPNENVEHIFQTIDGVVIAKIVMSDQELNSLLTGLTEEFPITDCSVETLLDSVWRPRLESIGEFRVVCTVCGNTVTTEGESVEIESGDRHLVCCTSCASLITDQYEQLRENNSTQS
jgi:Lrp/AsnC family leucine-responsive transcriptional regulator